MEEDNKSIDMSVAWAAQEMSAVNVAIVIVAHYSKLMAEGLEEYKAWELTIELAKTLYRKLWG
jgi:hypothetical protein